MHRRRDISRLVGWVGWLSNIADGWRQRMRNDVIFVKRFYTIAMRINVTDGGYMTTCRDTHFAVASEKAHSRRNAFFKKAVLLFVELSEAVPVARFLFGEFRSERDFSNSYGYITMHSSLLLIKFHYAKL